MKKLTIVHQIQSEVLKQIGNPTKNQSRKRCVSIDEERSRSFKKKEKKDAQHFITQTKKIELSNIQSLFWKENHQIQRFPSSFRLLRISEPLQCESVTIKTLTELNFPILSYKVRDLIKFSELILLQNEFCRCKFSKSTVHQLVEQIARNYNMVSYHNFSHAFSLMLLMYQCLVREPELKKILSQEQQFCVLIAALGHDLNHSGTNNAYEVKRKTTIARLVNNESVLENMHIRTLWKILAQKKKYNFIHKIENCFDPKKIITGLILNTDVSKHFKNVNRIKQLRENGQLSLSKHSQQKWFMIEQLFHACDLGNPCVDYQNYINWATLLSHQFNQQAKLEKFYNIQVTDNFVYHDLSTLYRDQVWFVGTLVYPLWKEIAINWSSLKIFVQNIEANIKRLQTEQLSILS